MILNLRCPVGTVLMCIHKVIIRFVEVCEESEHDGLERFQHEGAE